MVDLATGILRDGQLSGLRVIRQTDVTRTFTGPIRAGSQIHLGREELSNGLKLHAAFDMRGGANRNSDGVIMTKCSTPLCRTFVMRFALCAPAPDSPPWRSSRWRWESGLTPPSSA